MRAGLPAAPSDSRMVKLADVIPFRGLRYNQGLVPDLSLVVAPPYDVITPQAQDGYYKKHSHNAVRLDYGAASPADTDSDNSYTRAATALDEWLREKILVADPEPAIYCCREEYVTSEGKPAVRDAIIAAVRVADFSAGRVIPHEETSTGPREDRLRLMEATEANLSPIFCLYPDPANDLDGFLSPSLAAAPDLALTDEHGIRHSLWVVSDTAVIARISGFLSERNILIADGHHRYETALAYRDRRRSREGNPAGDQPYDFVMAYLSNMDSARGTIMPLHRLVSGLSWETVGELPPLLEERFEVTTVPGGGAGGRKAMMSALAGADSRRNVIGLHLPGDDSYHILTGREPRPMIGSDANGRSETYRSLDVTVLDRIILTEILEISTGGINEDAAVEYVEPGRVGAAEAGSHGVQAVFFMRAATLDDIKAITAAGEKMPRKSTYFYPKPLTGLVFRSLKSE